MGGFSIWHWMILAMVIAWAIAVGKILKRLGFSPAWGILAVFRLSTSSGFGSWPSSIGQSRSRTAQSTNGLAEPSPTETARRDHFGVVADCYGPIHP
jgi:hypothetical protein